MERMECGSSAGEMSDAEMKPISSSDQIAPVVAPKLAGKRAKIKEQIEFYFSDSNLSKDRFLLNEIKTNSKDGCKIYEASLRFSDSKSLLAIIIYRFKMWI